MGLASKLAAAGATGGYPPQPQGGQYPPQNAQQGSAYPGQQSYAPYPGGSGPPAQGSHTGQGQQQGYPPQQQQYGGVAPQQPVGPQEVGSYKSLLQRHVQIKSLQNFYPPNSPAIDQIANRAPQQINQLCAQWRLPKEVGQDVAKLGLYDIILFIDDSGSMQFEEDGERIKDLRLILSRVAYAATLFDEDGISIRFMNTNLPESRPRQSVGDNIKSEPQIEDLMRKVAFSGLTPLGTKLREKVLDPLVINEARNRNMKKPVLVVIITDGVPAGEPPGTIFETVRNASNEMNRAGLGPGALAFQFAQVGNDTKARDFLGKLDNDATVGQLVDCTSNFESESEEMLRGNPPVNLTPDMWLVKLLLGAIDPDYDSKDEAGAAPQSNQQYAPQGYQGPPQGYQGYQGGPPQGYRPPQGQPPPGGYQPPPGPPPNYQQQGQQGGQYGRPPPQQPQYGQPPPAPRY